MKNQIILTITFLFFSLGYSQTNVRLGADRQKVTIFEMVGPVLNFQIENDALRTVDLSGIVGTDDQTLAEVLTAGNDAANLNILGVSNIKSKFFEIAPSAAEVSAMRIRANNAAPNKLRFEKESSLGSGSFIGNFKTINLDGSPTDANDLTDKAYVDAQVLSAGTDDQTAAEVPFTPNGSIASTNVQLAIQEVRDEAGGADTNIGNTDLTLTGNRNIQLDSYNFTISRTSGPAALSITSNTFSIGNGLDVFASAYKIGGATSDDILVADGTTTSKAALIGARTASSTTYDNTTSGLTATNVQTAIDEVVATSGGTNNDVFTFAPITDGYTFTAADFTSGRKLFYYEGVTDITVNLSTDIATVGQKLQLWQYSTGKIQVDIDAALNGIEFATVDNINPITLTKQASTFGYRPIGNWEAYVSRGPFFFQDNAATAIPHEVDGTAGTLVSDGKITWTSTILNPQNGIRSLRATKTGGIDNESNRAELTLNGVLSGQNVTVTAYLDESSTQGTNWVAGMHSSSGWVTSSVTNLTSTGGFFMYTWTGTASINSPAFRVYTTSSGDVNDSVDLDNITVTIN